MERPKKSSLKRRTPSAKKKKVLNLYTKNQSRPKKDNFNYYKKNTEGLSARTSHRDKSAKTETGLMSSMLSNKVKKKPNKLGKFEKSIYRKPSKSPPILANKLDNRFHQNKSERRENPYKKSSRTPKDNLKKDLISYKNNPGINTYNKLMANVS